MGVGSGEWGGVGMGQTDHIIKHSQFGARSSGPVWEHC